MLERIEVPWWGRAPLAAALGALVGMIIAFVGRTASPEAILYALVPPIAFANIVMSDLGRRRFSVFASFGAAIGSLLTVRVLGVAGAALVAVMLGGMLARRLVGRGKHRETRKGLLFMIGAGVCPLATLAAVYLVQRMKPGAPLAVGLAVFHALFWLPTAGAEAALAWSAARARSPARRALEEPPQD